MIGRKSQDKLAVDEQSPQSFDDFALRLGDVMRGERATLGKSLLDVQRELRIKASYIAAIENCDPSAFDTPGFIAGYVRSYARYLGMDPDEAFAAFCAESGFSVAHGMSDQASVVRKPALDQVRPRSRDPLAEPRMPFAPANDSLFSRIEPGAIASSLVLLALIGGIGYGGYSVLQEVQRVRVTPVDQTPVVLSEIDPLDAALAPRDEAETATQDETIAGVFTPPSGAAFDRLYRPQALDVPVLVARDAPISTLDPGSVGLFSDSATPSLPRVQDSSNAAIALAEGLAEGDETLRQVRAEAPNLGQGVLVMATDEAWVEIKDESGKVLYSRIMQQGDSYAVPRDAREPRIAIGQAGGIYFAVDGTPFGPSGRPGRYAEVALDAAALKERFEPADPAADDDLLAVMVELDIKSRPAPTAVAALQPQGSATVARADTTPVSPQPEAQSTSLTQLAAQSTPRPAQPQAQISTPSPVAPASTIPQVTEAPAPGITVVASADTWVEVSLPSGKKIFAQTMRAGETYQVPQTAQAAKIFSGNAGGVYFAVNGQTYGPYGESGQFGRNLQLSASAITQRLQVADLSRNQTLAKVVAELRAGAAPQTRP
ncbi:RodZ domain-containing protein [Pseudoponticoccus marisrubri]|uniref:Cytoskeleton protein RodZ-like C-terminal domain-containing protein n=1 Tax=Pseudoponticoccus marisrubri TaxID=1685382 RepID=A0A0W7WLY2_9RHOB|nr:RodZ domain-containing protein [Pseudoponticoccus marisrubri]KUF11602.1 hypothetical protein AVJ23_07550 [Pseudoponticoccus marisrubri]